MPQMRPFSVLPSRFSNLAGLPEIQELKKATELRSQLRTVSEGAGWVRGRAGGSGPPGSCGALSWGLFAFRWPRSSPDFPATS